jgi:aconitate hydratase
VMPVHEAAVRYQGAGVPLIVLAGKEYGSGSSRDWAAKGPYLLGVRAVIAQSFERIHRSNLIGMGVLPLVFPEGGSAESLGLTGRERFSIEAVTAPGQLLGVSAASEDGRVTEFAARARIDSAAEIELYRNGGILPAVVRELAQEKRT